MSRRLIALLVPLAFAGCFRDTMSGDDDDGTTGAESTSAASTLTTTISGSATAPATSNGPGTTTTVDTESESDPSSTTDVEATDVTTGSTVTTDGPMDTTTDTTTGDPTGTTADTTGMPTGTTTGDELLTVAELTEGDLLITEVMFNPQCNFDDCEWIEVLNASGSPVQLQGLGLGDRDAAGNPQFQTSVPFSLIVMPDELVVLTKVGADWPYSTVNFDAAYGSGLALNNDIERVFLLGPNDFEIDRSHVFFGGPETEGRSTALMPAFWNSTANDDSRNWCSSDDPIDATGDFGTPGSTSVTCVGA